MPKVSDARRAAMRRYYLSTRTLKGRPTPADRFWPKVNKNGPVPESRPDLGPCWLWLARLNNKGYGEFSFDGRPQCAHRISFRLVVGAIPDGLELDHLCRIPACVNPAHLEPVTHQENIRRGLPAQLSAACPKGHALVEPNLYVSRRGARTCRQCAMRRAQEQRVRNRGDANLIEATVVGEVVTFIGSTVTVLVEGA